MQVLTAIGIALLVLLLWPALAAADAPTVAGLIESIGEAEGLQEWEIIELVAVARCEGDLQLYPADGDHGKSVGPLQFHQAGIWWDTPYACLGLAARRDPETAIRAGVWVWRYRPQWKEHWTCWRLLRRSSGLAVAGGH